MFIIRRWHKPKSSQSPLVNSYSFNNNNIFLGKDSEEDIEDIDVGDEKGRADIGEDVSCSQCHDTFPNLPSFLQHRQTCSSCGTSQETGAARAGLQRATAGLLDTYNQFER